MASGEVQTQQMSGQKKMERGSMSISLAQSFVCCAPGVKPAGVDSDVAIPAAACPSIGEDCANGSVSSSASRSESDDGDVDVVVVFVVVVVVVVAAVVVVVVVPPFELTAELMVAIVCLLDMWARD